MAKQAFQIGIDLGTANTLVYIAKKGIVYNEPSIVAYDRDSGKCIAVGSQAKLMLGKTHDKIKVVKPMEGGVIADLDATKTIIEVVFKSLTHIQIDYPKSTLLLCCPSEITVVEKSALIKLAHDFGIKDVFIEQEVKAGAIGAGIDIFTTEGSMVVDIGGGSTDIAVLSCGDLVVWESVRVAGVYFDSEIAKYIKLKHNLLIGAKTAENVKIQLATLKPIGEGEDSEIEVAGRHLRYGRPAKVKIKKSEVRDIMIQAFTKIKHVILNTLAKTPPELSSDILNRGLVVNGGGAMIDGIKEYFETEVGIKCTISQNPLTSIVEGTKYLLQNRGSYIEKPIE